ncbi:phage tail spike protein [Cytobacillus horneckiae]|uniref:phage tail spike protein n=1 Tax=Cytobacillus horneckiae TaxID=549687 RepID=UPI003D9A0B97
MIHILDKQTDTILAFLNKELTAADHDENLNHEETFDFTVRVGEKSQFIKDRNRAIIPVEDGSFREFIIINTQTNSSSVYAKGNASYLDLDKQRVIEPGIIEGQTLESISNRFLTGTEWQLGEADFSGSRKVTIENHIGVFQALKQLCTLFEVEMRFRVEVKGNRVAGRFVDFYKRRGQFRGKEVVFGKDLIEIRRIEDGQNTVTALFCIGPEKEDGSRITTIVKDDEALQRWGRNGRHLWSVYEPESTDTEMSLSRLTQLGNMELKKRINSLVKYETTQAVLDSIKELDHEKVFIADTLRIKDEHFTPPLYAEARVHQVRRSLLDKSKKDYVLGDFIQYSKDEVRKRFKELQKIYGVKVIKSPTQPIGRYETIWIDTSGEFEVIKTWNGVSWVAATPTRAEEIGAIDVEDAIDMVNRGKKEAIDESVNIAIEQDRVIQRVIEDKLAAESERLLNDATTKVNNLREEVSVDIGNLNSKADNLVTLVDTLDADLKANNGTVTSLKQSMNELTGEVTSISGQVTSIDGTLSQTVTKVSQLTTGLEAKAEKTVVDTLTGNVSSISSQVEIIAGQLSSKAEASSVYTKTETDTKLGQKVEKTIYDNKISEITQSISGITSRVSTTETKINQQTGEIDTAKQNIATLQQTSQGFETRVSSLETDLNNVSGGYNLIQNSQFRGGFQGWVVHPTYNNTWTYDEQKKLLDENTVKFTYFDQAYPMLRSVMVPVENTEIVGKKVTLSVYIFVPSSVTFAAGRQPYIQICGYNNPNDNANYSFQTYNVPNTIERDKWVRINVTATITPNLGTSVPVVKYIAAILRYNNSSFNTPVGMTFWYGLPQMEIGSKAMNWSPSPKDISNRVEWAESEIKIQSGLIESKVSSKDYTGNVISSMINQTATTIKIQASKINLVGAVTAEMLDVTDLSAITSKLGKVYIVGKYSGLEAMDVDDPTSHAWTTKVSISTGMLIIEKKEASDTPYGSHDSVWVSGTGMSVKPEPEKINTLRPKSGIPIIYDLPYEYRYITQATGYREGVIWAGTSKAADYRMKEYGSNELTYASASRLYINAENFGIGTSENLFMDVRAPASGTLKSSTMLSFPNKVFFRSLASSGGEFRFSNRVDIDSTVLKLWGSKTGNNYVAAAGNVVISSDKVNIGADFAVGADDSARIWSMAIYNRVYTNSAANVHVTNAGTLGRAGSARRYKLLIEDMDQEQFPKILQVNPRTWFDKGQTERYSSLLEREANGEEIDWENEDVGELKRITGVIAEEVEAAGLNEFVQYKREPDGTHSVQGVAYERLWLPLIPIVRSLVSRVEQLESKLK